MKGIFIKEILYSRNIAENNLYILTLILIESSVEFSIQPIACHWSLSSPSGNIREPSVM